ncbi:MAG TPA: PrgI family protein [Patescibacteria group bacterium]|nr:PrgI family protein [Patescibacteria group bacterium]
MATYKLIQDIEAEDHILGPLTLRQFIYSLVAAFCLYVSFIGLTKHVLPLIAMFLPVALFAGFFAFPFGKDQPTEVWALAKIRFFFKPRRRIWDQSGVKELVTITVPKRVEVLRSDGLSQTEVKSRLRALADTIDSRGWAIKNVNINMYGQASPVASGSSDRLIDISSMPRLVPDYDVQASDDMLDEQSNPVAQQFAQMITSSSQTHRKKLIDKLNNVRLQEGQNQAAGSGAPADYWFLNQPGTPQDAPPGSAVFTQSQVVQPGSDDTAPSAVTAEEAALVARMKQQNDSQPVYNSHLRTIKPLGATPKAGNREQVTESRKSQEPEAKKPDAAILELANNNDFNVSTLARQAQKAKNPKEPPEDEITISLR